jgi:hypothetical protein
MVDKSHPVSLLKIASYMILMGALTWWIAVLLIPLAIEREFAESAADRMPVYGFFIGAALGFGMHLFAAIRESVFAVFGAIAFGGVLWFFSLLVIGGGLLLIGMSEEAVDRIMDWVGPAAFFLGIVVGGVGVFAVTYEGLGTLRARLKSGRHKAP